MIRRRLDDVQVSRQPLRVVVDTNARTPATARVLDDDAATVIAVAEDADTSALDGRCEIVRPPRGERGLDVHALLGALQERGVRCVFLEGGSTLPARSSPASSTA